MDLARADSVREVFLRGAEANRAAACRRGSIDVIRPPGRLIATGDLHDNPAHFLKLVRVAGLDRDSPEPGTHLVLHEVIHSDRLVNGMDFSFRALARIADLKSRFPEQVHTLLANHELAQIVGTGIVKDGVRVVEAFDAGVEYAFGDEAESVEAAIDEFIRSMPIALRCVTPRGDILCAHSVPGPGAMGKFDTGILDRDLTDADYEPLRGSAYLMVWGRRYDAESLEDLVERWGAYLFILGHERAEQGVEFRPPCAIVLNSDHDRGVYLPIDLSDPPSATEALASVVPLASVPSG